MGSCFALEVCNASKARGFQATDAGLGIKYNTYSKLQSVYWALEGEFGDKYLTQVKAEDGWIAIVILRCYILINQKPCLNIY